MSYLNFISCATCHGEGTKKLFDGLIDSNSAHNLSSHLETPYFAIPELFQSTSQRKSFEKLIRRQLNQISWSDFLGDQKWGVIFASTKGRIEDLIWQDQPPQQDPYFEILEDIENNFPLQVSRSVAVSNACASSHSAIELANRWIQLEKFDHVLVVAGDLIGDFTLKGFQTLRALSPTQRVRPFDRQRDGLLLGDGVATAILSQKPQKPNALKIQWVNTLCEGVSATRPDVSGRHLTQCFDSANFSPDLVMTHGTATYYNDLTESNALRSAFSKVTCPPITSSKWSVGHTLGASGLIDLGLAFEIFKNQKAPGIQTLQDSDLPVAEFLLRKPTPLSVNKILISSLGFGGMCSAMSLEWEDVS